jgi:glyoxylase-like metal-dependent hydrolase (beta-lactamase superfamily II)
MKRALSTILAAALLCSCGRAPELKAVKAASEALGGQDKILAVRTLTIEGEGENSNLGQNLTPDAPLTVWKVTNFKRTIDFAKRLDQARMRVEQVRTAQFPFALATVSRQNMVLDGNVAWNVNEDGSPSSRLTDQTALDRRMELLHHPVTILRAALDPHSKLSQFRTMGNLQLVDIATANGDTLTLAVNGTSHLPASVSSMTDQPNLGDVAIETSFTEYEDVDGLKLPKHLTTKIDKWVQSDIRVSKYTLNGSTGDLTAPAAVSSALPAPANPPVEVTAEKVAPGIWWLAGSGNHRSVAFEFADHLTLFELPESETRAKAVIEKAHSLAFGKPLTEIVVSHPHFDHSAGLRVAVAEGLTIITQSGNVAFFKELAARKHTIIPDQLAQAIAAQPIKIKPVDDQLVLKDASMELDLYHVKDNSHSDTMLMGWVPGDHILVQADLYDSGWLRYPWADNLKKNVELRKLQVEKDVPIHGDIESWAAVLKRMQEKQ